MDDVAVATDNCQEAEIIIQIIKTISNSIGIQISPKKSAYAHKFDTNTLLSTINNIQFKDISNSLSCRYLRIWINLDLNWTEIKLDYYLTLYLINITLVYLLHVN